MERFFIELFQFQELQIFVDKYDFPFFVGSNLVTIFDYTETRNMYDLIPDIYKVKFENLNLDEEVRAMADPTKIKSNSICLTEEGLYFVAFTSRKPIAVAFRDWIATDLLVVLRKTGKYKMKERLIFKDQKLVELSKEANDTSLTLAESVKHVVKLNKKIKRLYVEILYHRKKIRNLIIADGYIYVRKVSARLFAVKVDAYKIGRATDLEIRDNNYKVGGMNAPLIVYYPIDDLDLVILENVIKANIEDRTIKYGTETFWDIKLDPLLYTIKTAIKSQRKINGLEPRPVEIVALQQELDTEFDKRVDDDDKTDAILVIKTNLVDVNTPMFSIYLKRMEKDETASYDFKPRKIKLMKRKKANEFIDNKELVHVDDFVPLTIKYNVVDVIEIQLQYEKTLQKEITKNEKKVNNLSKTAKIPIFKDKRAVLLTLLPFFGKELKYIYEEGSDIDKYVRSEKSCFETNSKDLEIVMLKMKPYLVTASYYKLLQFRNSIAEHIVITTVDEKQSFDYNSE